MNLINDSVSVGAYKKKIDLGFTSRKYGSSRCMSLIGVLAGAETVSLEIPKVLNPDETVDSDWTPLIQFSPVNGVDEPVVFIAGGENAKFIPADITVRVVKTVTASALGVAYS